MSNEQTAEETDRIFVFSSSSKIPLVSEIHKRFWRIVDENSIADTPAGDARLFGRMQLVFCVVLFVMSCMNWYTQSYYALITTSSVFVITLVCALWCLIKRRHRGPCTVCGIAVYFMLTFFLYDGCNDGFAVNWMLVAPICSMLWFNIKQGMVYSGCLFLELIIFFWAGASDFLAFQYTDTYMLRFPMLYLCIWAITLVIVFRLRMLQLMNRDRKAETLAALKAEREKTQNASIEVIHLMCAAMEAKDSYTQGHSSRVALMSRRLAYYFAVDEAEAEAIYHAALLHDIGKIGISDAILSKAGKLTQEEYGVIKTHPLISRDILTSTFLAHDVLNGALYHHERWDGHGYPEGLKGNDIPRDARIISVADAIDAMASKRTYQDAQSFDTILDQLRSNAGSQFDPAVVEAAVFLIKRVAFNDVISCGSDVRVPEMHLA